MTTFIAASYLYAVMIYPHSVIHFFERFWMYSILFSLIFFFLNFFSISLIDYRIIRLRWRWIGFLCILCRLENFFSPNPLFLFCLVKSMVHLNHGIIKKSVSICLYKYCTMSWYFYILRLNNGMVSLSVSLYTALNLQFTLLVCHLCFQIYPQTLNPPP